MLFGVANTWSLASLPTCLGRAVRKLGRGELTLRAVTPMRACRRLVRALISMSIRYRNRDRQCASTFWAFMRSQQMRYATQADKVASIAENFILLQVQVIGGIEEKMIREGETLTTKTWR